MVGDLVQRRTALGAGVICLQALVGCHAATRDVTPKYQNRGSPPVASAAPSGVPVANRVARPDAMLQVDISVPGNLACTIKTRTDSTVSLRPAEGAKPFAELSDVPLTLLVPAGAPLASLAIESENDGVWLRGIGKMEELDFHLNRAVLLDGIVMPNHHDCRRVA